MTRINQFANNFNNSQEYPNNIKAAYQPDVKVKNSDFTLNHSYHLPPSLHPIQSDSNTSDIFGTIGTIKEPKMIKKTCARCKESNKCIKLLYSKIGKVEELVNSLAKNTVCHKAPYNRNNIKNQQIGKKLNKNNASKTWEIPQIVIQRPDDNYDAPDTSMAPNLNTSAPFDLFTNGRDISSYSLEDLQKAIMTLTRAMIYPSRN
ncbi:2274_t:CDS:2 [Diversispora eburnea]|uniref:2274_t:CDS:1 n=1 Tax=Diversispora eburnea TaxID=1213867 RepID=A0A9N9F0V1_9GLOM|nr:2274_t:CDS:2 [Diversispora eburnea]